MKKRLISLLVALCMAVTLLPVSALTAWAEGGGQLKIVNGYPEGSRDDSNGTYTISCSGDGWSYDGSTQTLELHPDSPKEYNFLSIISGNGNVTQCNLTIGENATIVEGNFKNTVINNGKISGGYFYSSSSSLTNHGSITGGKFLHAITNEFDGTIENGTFISNVTNSGNIKGGIFSEKPTGGNVAKGYTLNVNLQNTGSYRIISAAINDLSKSGYVIPNTDYNTSVTIEYAFFSYSQKIVFPIGVTFGDTNDTPCLLEDWAPSASYSTNNHGGDFSVTFTAPPANADTVTLSMLTRLVIDKNGYPVGPRGSNKNYSGDGWKFKNGTLILEPATEKSYDFNGTDLNPHGVAVNCPVTVDSNTTITNGIFLKEVTGSALNGVFLNVPTGCENSAKKITVSDNGKITALKMSGEATALDSAANELYVVGTPTDSTLYVTLSNGKVREVQLPLTADLELQLNDPEPEPEPETYTLKVVGGSFTTGERDALTSGTVPVDAEAKVTLNPDAVPEGMVFDQWTISEESLLGNPRVAYNAESFTIPANSVKNGKTVTVEAQYRDATIESEGPDILGTAAMIGTVGVSAAVLGYQGYMLGTELYLKYALPSGVSIPTNTAELAVLIWNDAGQPAPAAVLEEDATSEQKALTWAVENQLLSADKAADASIGRAEVIRVWNQAQKMK